MRRRFYRFSAWCALGLALLTSARDSFAQGVTPGDVVQIARSFPDGGGYEWRGSGVPEDICFDGTMILPKGKATYCSGFTFAVAMKSAGERGLLHDKSVDDIRTFQKQWYGSSKE